MAADSVERWLRVRAVLRERRHELSHVAARLYPGAPAGRAPRPARRGGTAGIPFTAGTVARFTGRTEPVQASGAALLALAWQHRRHLLAR